MIIKVPRLKKRDSLIRTFIYKREKYPSTWPQEERLTKEDGRRGRRWRKRRRTFALCSIVRRRRNRRVRRRRRRKRGRPLYLPQGVPSPPLPGGGVHTSAEDREVRPFSSSSCMAAAPEFPGDQVRRGEGGEDIYSKWSWKRDAT